MRRIKKGFTLVELIISLTILSILFATMYFALGTQIRLWQGIVNAAEKQQIANAVLNRMVNDIRSAREILPASSSQVLSLRIESSLIEYSLFNEKVRRKKNGYSSYLTDKKELQMLSFSYPGFNRVEIDLDGLKASAALRN